MNENKKASDYLREYQSSAETLQSGVGRIRRLSADPVVAVGVLGGSDTPYLLVLPDKTVNRNVDGINLKVQRSRTLNLIDEDTEIRDVATVTAISFRSLSYASEVLLDILVDEAITSKDPASVGELAEDFLELFVPSEGLTRSELLGYWGELFLIWGSIDKDLMGKSWHRKDEDRYDFAFGNERLEVKATEGSRRSHSFSSSQIPPPDGVDVLVASVLTNEVPAGVSFVELYEDIRLTIGSAQEMRVLATQFAKVLAKDPEQFERTLFDIEMAKATLKFFQSSSIPKVTLDQGASRARWRADLEGIPEADTAALRSSRLAARSDQS